VPAEVLATLTNKHGLHIVTVVGSVQSNNRWLQENLADVVAPGGSPSDDDWSNIFDEGNAAVMLDLQGDEVAEAGGLEILSPEPEDGPEGEDLDQSSGQAA